MGEGSTAHPPCFHSSSEGIADEKDAFKQAILRLQAPFVSPANQPLLCLSLGLTSLGAFGRLWTEVSACRTWVDELGTFVKHQGPPPGLLQGAWGSVVSMIPG